MHLARQNDKTGGYTCDRFDEICDLVIKVKDEGRLRIHIDSRTSQDRRALYGGTRHTVTDCDLTIYHDKDTSSLGTKCGLEGLDLFCGQSAKRHDIHLLLCEERGTSLSLVLFTCCGLLRNPQALLSQPRQSIAVPLRALSQSLHIPCRETNLQRSRNL